VPIPVFSRLPMPFGRFANHTATELPDSQMQQHLACKNDGPARGAEPAELPSPRFAPLECIIRPIFLDHAVEASDLGWVNLVEASDLGWVNFG